MKDMESKLLALSGLKTEEEKAASPLAPKPCSRCKPVDPATGKFCSQCSMTLDLQTVMELEEARSKADSFMSRLLEDQEVQRLLAQKIKQLHLQDQASQITGQ